MKFNSAQQTAHTILSEAGARISRTLVQKGAVAFYDPDYYRSWRNWCEDHIKSRLTHIYGSHILDNNSDYYWIWQILPEYANLCHNLPYYTLAMIRMQHDQPTDLVIFCPADNRYIAAALGAGCYSLDGRARVSKQREPSTSMLYAGEGLPGTLRCLGSPLLEIAMVANGELDAGCWDDLSDFLCMAARLLLAESGGIATSKSGDKLTLEHKRNSLLIANLELHSRLAPLIGCSSTA